MGHKTKYIKFDHSYSNYCYGQKLQTVWLYFLQSFPRTNVNRRRVFLICILSFPTLPAEDVQKSSFAAPRESKSMGNTPALSTKGRIRVAQQHERRIKITIWNIVSVYDFKMNSGCLKLRHSQDEWDLISVAPAYLHKKWVSKTLDFLWSLLLFSPSESHFPNLLA